MSYSSPKSLTVYFLDLATKGGLRTMNSDHVNSQRESRGQIDKSPIAALRPLDLKMPTLLSKTFWPTTSFRCQLTSQTRTKINGNRVL